MSRLFGTDGIRGVANTEPLTPELAFRVGRQLVATLGEHGVERVRIVIGRDSDCDVRVVSAMVSGKHCELRFDGSVWRAIDLGSKNGTQVNGIPVTEQVLAAGDLLSLARQHSYRIDYPPEPSPAGGRLMFCAVLGTIAATLGLTCLYLWRLLAN